MPHCDCQAHRDQLVEALGQVHGLSRRNLLRGAAGVGAVIALGSALPAWADEDREIAGSWLAGDLHCHTVLSHDVWGGPDDDNTGLDETYTWGWTAGEQITIAESRGLNFLALTDHNRTDALRLPEYRSSTLTLIPGYEHSLSGGHAGVFVPSAASLADVIRQPDGGTDFAGAAGLASFLDQVHSRHGIVVLNHPFYKRDGATAPPTWSYDVASSLGVDAMEVWNSVWFNRSELTQSIAYDDPAALPWWEQEFLPRRHLPMVGGSDNHWRILTGIAGVGQPTTWVYAVDRRVSSILDAIRAGRTTVSAQPPALGGARIEPTVVEDWPAGRTATVGGRIGAQGPLVVRTRVRNGEGLTLRLISTGRVIASTGVTSPDTVVEQSVVLPDRGWLRLELFARRPGVDMVALSSPVYAARRAPRSVRKPASTGPRATYPMPRALS
jgi:predicted metal-dependent phosphoesterase TrpH